MYYVYAKIYIILIIMYLYYYYNLYYSVSNNIHNNFCMYDGMEAKEDEEGNPLGSDG